MNYENNNDIHSPLNLRKFACVGASVFNYVYLYVNINIECVLTTMKRQK